MFTLLLFVKCFHWLAEDRVDYVSQFRRGLFSLSDSLVNFLNRTAAQMCMNMGSTQIIKQCPVKNRILMSSCWDVTANISIIVKRYLAKCKLESVIQWRVVTRSNIFLERKNFGTSMNYHNVWKINVEKSILILPFNQRKGLEKFVKCSFFKTSVIWKLLYLSSFILRNCFIILGITSLSYD